MPDTVLLQDIWPIRNKVKVGNSIGILVYRIGTVSLFIILKDRSIKNVILKDCLYVLELMKSPFSWSKLKSLTQDYLEDRGDMLVCNIVNNEVILWVREYLCTHLFNIIIRTL
jgi:hypothetical protein